MPKGTWTPKEERQYEHVKDSELAAGRPAKRAKEIAARTVNKARGKRKAAGKAARHPARKPTKKRGRS